MANPSKPVRLSWVTIDPAGRCITLYASKLAAVAGLHPYESQDELKGELLRALGANPAFVTNGERARAELSSLPAARRERLMGSLKTAHGSAPDVQAALEAALQDNPDLSNSAKEEVRRALYTQHGVQKEAGVLRAASSEAATPIAPQGAFRVSAAPVLTLAGGYSLRLGGRLDGSTADGRVVEIKTRLKRLLGAPTYELIQVHGYMAITGTRDATLIESYEGQRATHEVRFDEELWGQVVAAAGAFFELILAAAGAEGVQPGAAGAGGSQQGAAADAEGVQPGEAAPTPEADSAGGPASGRDVSMGRGGA